MALQPVGVGDEVLSELREGRTRELLLLLQDKPVPEVVDPINLQSALSQQYEYNINDDITLLNGTLIDDFEDGDKTVAASNWTGWTDEEDFNVDGLNPLSGSNGARIPGGGSAISVRATRDTVTTESVEFQVEVEDSVQTSGDYCSIEFIESGVESVIELKFVDSSNDLVEAGGSTTIASDFWSAETIYDILVDFDFSNDTAEININGETIVGDLEIPNFSGSLTGWDEIVFENNTFNSSSDREFRFDTIYEGSIPRKTGYVTDKFSAPTTEPADFKAWNAIQARDVTTGGSTSADPVEFEILDSTGTTLNSTRIPKARIADEPFVMRNRVYIETAGSDGQSGYQIATTGDGGHFDIPVLTVVSVKKNGSVLESANWSFDPDTNTVSIDTSNVSIASGDTIDIKYDFDVFDSTLQPRAYLNRESASETSPSISHFRYEYVI